MKSPPLTATLGWVWENGKDRLQFFLPTEDLIGLEALRDATRIVKTDYCRPNGQGTEVPDTVACLPAKWRDGMGLLVKHIQAGAGLLADVHSTDDLTETMARHSWTWFDGDTV